MSPLSCPEGSGWGFIGRMGKIRYIWFHLCLGTTAFTYNQLFARRGDLPNPADDPWTTFQMDLREDAPIPVAFDFTRFLVSSITFMAHLRQVSVYFNDKRLALLSKDAGLPMQVPIPQGLRPTSTTGIMNIKELKSTRKWFVGNEARSVLIIITLYSPQHYCGSHGPCLQYRDRDVSARPQNRISVYIFLWVRTERPPAGILFTAPSVGYERSGVPPSRPIQCRIDDFYGRCGCRRRREAFSGTSPIHAEESASYTQVRARIRS